MIDSELLKRRLEQYGAAWLAAFLLALAVAALAHGLAHVGLARVADITLIGLFSVLTLAVAAAAVHGLAAEQTVPGKVALALICLVLLMPLLWSPVLALQAYARFSGAALEYSEVYAGFRIAVARALWNVTELIFNDPSTQAALRLAQTVSAVVGFLAACAQIWRLLARPRRPIEG